MSAGPSPELVRLATAVAAYRGAPERILQVECGEGEGVLYLAREYPSARVRGVDASAVAIRAAMSRTGLDPEGRVAFKQGGPRPLPYPDEMFDLVIQTRGTPHGEVARVLRPGGCLVCVEAPGRRFRRALTRRLRHRLQRLGFETLRDNLLDDRGFYVGLLPEDRSAPPD